jgi:hypothetical protein
MLRFFPWIRCKPKELEKQNATLYGSLKQMCRKGAAKAFIQKYEQKRDGMRTWLDLLKRYDNMGSNDVMTILYYAVLTQPYHQNFPGGLEQFATDHEKAYCELARIGEHHRDLAQRRKILTNLYDPANPESKLLVVYCEQNCTTFSEVIDHLTDTYIRDSHYNSIHSARKAKTSQTTHTDSNDASDDDSDLRFILQSTHGKHLPADYKIPTQAWRLLSPEAKLVFISAHDKEYRHLFPNSMEALDMMKFKMRHTCPYLGE